MRLILAALALTIGTAALCVGQEASDRAAPGIGATENVQSYVVEITEFKLAKADDPKLTASEILKAFDDQDRDRVQLIETVRVSALEGHESMVQFGKRVAVTTGTTSTQFGKARNMQERAVGTVLKVTAVTQEERVLLKISYEAARLSDNETEDSPADTLNTQYSAMLLLTPDTPRLAGGTTASGGSYLRIQVSKQ